MHNTYAASPLGSVGIPATTSRRRRACPAAPIEEWLERHRAPLRTLGPDDYVGSPAALRIIAGLAAAVLEPDLLRASGGSLPAVLVSGPAGCGKSRLLTVLEASCQEEVACYEIGATELTGDIVRAIVAVLQPRDRPSVVTISQLDAIAVAETGLGGSAASEARPAVWALIDALDPGVRPPSGRNILWAANFGRSDVPRQRADQARPVWRPSNRSSATRIGRAGSHRELPRSTATPGRVDRRRQGCRIHGRRHAGGSRGNRRGRPASIPCRGLHGDRLYAADGGGCGPRR